MRARLAAAAAARTWLDLQRLVDRCLEVAVAVGGREIDEAAVDAVLGPRPAQRRTPEPGDIDAILAAEVA